jgi:hypothetical protein
MWSNELTLIEVPCLAKTQARSRWHTFGFTRLDYLVIKTKIKKCLTHPTSSYKGQQNVEGDGDEVWL